VTVPVIACWAEAAEAKVTAANPASMIFAIFMEVSRNSNVDDKPAGPNLFPPCGYIREVRPV
jgi:hypothetical protein